MTRARAACAGAAAALAWAALEPIDIRLLGNDYSDTAMLGKLVTRSRLWPFAGLAVHAANGAAFGLAYRELRRRTGRGSAVGLALAEHTLLYPLGVLVDRLHPARGSRGLAPMISKRGFAQETLRHAVFGALLGRLAR